MKANSLKTNPFVFGKIAKEKQFVNRIHEREELAGEIENHTNIILFAPRRYGKTSLVLQTFSDLQKKHKNKFAGLFIDFYGINSKEKFMISLTREYAANSGLTIEKILTFFKNTLHGVVPMISVDQFGNPKFEISFTPSSAESALKDVLNLPQKLAESGKLTAVLFDEFQEITALNGNDFQKELRSVIQHHNLVSYIFSGSKYHLFRDIFNRQSSPLYNAGKSKYLAEIPENDFVTYITRHLKKINKNFNNQAALSIIRMANGIPYYVQMLAHEVYNLALLNPQQEAVNLINMAVENILADKNDEFLTVYENLSLSARRVLEIVIQTNGTGLFRKELLSQHNIAASTLKKALLGLTEKGILNKNKAQYVFQDIFFKKWLKRVIFFTSAKEAIRKR